MRPQAPQESEAVDERHPQIEDDGVGPASFGLAKTHFGVHRRADLIALQTEHPGERRRHPFIVVDDEDCGGRPIGLLSAGTGLL